MTWRKQVREPSEVFWLAGSWYISGEVPENDWHHVKET